MTSNAGAASKKPAAFRAIADERNYSYQIIKPDIERHPQQRYLRNAVADASEENVKRSERCDRIADIGDKAYQRIKPETPAGAGNAKKAIEIMRKVFEAFFDLDLGMLFSRHAKDTAFFYFFHKISPQRHGDTEF